MEQDNANYYFPAKVKDFFVGGTIGTLLGCGVVYLLNKTGMKSESVGFPLDSIELATGVVGAVGNAVLTHLRHNNIDRNPGNLIRQANANSQDDTRIPHLNYNLEGIANCVKLITEGITNKGIEEVIYRKVSWPLRNEENDPFHKPHLDYGFVRDGYFVNQFGVFDSFNYQDQHINPKLSIDDLFDTGHKLYKLTMDRINREAGKLSGSTLHSFLTKEEHNRRYATVKTLLERWLKDAHNIALWVNYLSHREGIVGNKVRNKLSSFGISNVDYFSEDIEKMGNNALRLYDAWESKQLESYRD